MEESRVGVRYACSRWQIVKDRDALNGPKLKRWRALNWSLKRWEDKEKKCFYRGRRVWKSKDRLGVRRKRKREVGGLNDRGNLDLMRVTKEVEQALMELVWEWNTKREELWKTELQMERVELQTKIFIGGDGANGNEGIKWTDTVVNDGVIDLDNQWHRNPISDVELSSLELSSDTTSWLSSHSRKHIHTEICGMWMSAHTAIYDLLYRIFFHIINRKMYYRADLLHTHARILHWCNIWYTQPHNSSSISTLTTP